jgi:O-antigen/teichoic acid export membrane protein
MKYFKNTSWLFGGQMLRMVLGLFVSVAVARYLGPKDFGLYNYVLSIVALVGVVAGLGLQNLAKRELVEQPERRDAILGTCFVLSLLAGVIAYAAMLFTVGCVSDRSLVIGLFTLLGGTLFLSPLKCIEIWFQSQVRADLSVAASSITLLIFAAIKVAAIYFGGNLMHFAYIFLFESIVLTGLLVVFYKRHFGRLFAWRAERKLALEFLKQSWPLLLSGLAITIYMKVDQVMLGAMLGDEAVGQYSVAVRISSVWYFIPTILAASLFPAILNARRQSAQIYEARLQRYFDLNAGLAYLVCIPLTFAAPLIITILFGAEYHSAAPILAIHAWSSLFVFLGVARNQYLVAEKLYKFSMLTVLTGAVVNVLGNWVLIPLQGGKGAAIATLISQFTAAYLTCWLFLPTHFVARLLSKSVLPIHLLKSISHEKSSH